MFDVEASEVPLERVAVLPVERWTIVAVHRLGVTVPREDVRESVNVVLGRGSFDH